MGCGASNPASGVLPEQPSVSPQGLAPIQASQVQPGLPPPPIGGGRHGSVSLGALGKSFKDRPNKRLALHRVEQDGFWSDEAFQEMVRDGQPPHDARVLDLLLSDSSDGNLKRAAVKVYLKDAAAEWGDDVIDLCMVFPGLAAVFGLAASIIARVESNHVNRQNCKLLQETVRSVAVVLLITLRQMGPGGIRASEDYLPTKTMEITRVLLASRGLITNYSSKSFTWILMLASAKQDKARFESLHFNMEQLTQNLLGVISDTQWCAPPDAYQPYMERVAARVGEATEKRMLPDAVAVLGTNGSACAKVATLLKMEPTSIQEAATTALPVLIKQRTAAQQQALAAAAAQTVDPEKRAADAQQKFEALRVAAAQPKAHAHKTKAERDAALLNRQSESRVSDSSATIPAERTSTRTSLPSIHGAIAAVDDDHTGTPTKHSKKQSTSSSGRKSSGGKSDQGSEGKDMSKLGGSKGGDGPVLVRNDSGESNASAFSGRFRPASAGSQNAAQEETQEESQKEGKKTKKKKSTKKAKEGAADEDADTQSILDATTPADDTTTRTGEGKTKKKKGSKKDKGGDTEGAEEQTTEETPKKTKKAKKKKDPVGGEGDGDGGAQEAEVEPPRPRSKLPPL